MTSKPKHSKPTDSFISTPTPSKIRTHADLRQLQRTMAAALMQLLTRQDGMKSSTQVDFITPNDRMSGFERLEIYARQCWYRLIDCLYDENGRKRSPLMRLLKSRFVGMIFCVGEKRCEWWE